jgi:hypothetical protein
LDHDQGLFDIFDAVSLDHVSLRHGKEGAGKILAVLIKISLGLGIEAAGLAIKARLRGKYPRLDVLNLIK